jgi:hypothetical protein
VTRLKVDTWDPEYGLSFEAIDSGSDEETLDAAQVEEGPWAPFTPSERPSATQRVGFIDGVRRIDARLFAEDAGAFAPALAGSWAVGVAWTDRPPAIGPVQIGRELVIGGGLSHDALGIRIGTSELTFQPSSVPGGTPIDPIQGLQNAMREAEANLAREIFETVGFDLFVLDGPLTYFGLTGPVVGMIKRQNRPYLSAEQAPILAVLDVGERTPVFKIGEQRLERYSWYARIGARRPIDGTMTGIVRLETTVSGGIEATRDLANLTALMLPRFATEWGRDPRAPQNLYPISRLESDLHHRLGNRLLIKRAIESALWSSND